MARYVTHPSARSPIAGAVVAGIIGAFFIHAFFFAVGLARFPATYNWIASGVVGRAAYTGHWEWLGVLLHLAISIVIATLYVYVAQVTGLIGRPLLGGTLLGIATNGVMDLIVYARLGTPLPTTWHDIAIPLVAHVVFFGVPIALYLARYERVPIPYT